ncbi:hypothetical protein HZA43_05040 [Candidatus Peregrinibacteria bacterium]|nr:hypothetical protein [Candidatus Peregrinibacteria bacterium]
MKYILEIYEPDSADDVLKTFESDSPFASMSKGDILSPIFDGSEIPMKVQKIKNIEHIIWEASGETSHKICVFTEGVDGTRELRLA